MKTRVLESLFNKVTGLGHVALLKRRLWHRHFPVNFVKFLRTPFFTEQLRATASVVFVFLTMDTLTLYISRKIVSFVGYYVYAYSSF